MEARQPSILIIDDDQYIVDLIREYLSGLSMDCTGFTDPRNALTCLEKRTFDLVLTDLRMGRVSGMDILRAAVDPDPSGTMVIMMTSYPTVEDAIEAMQSGVENYILKPFSLDALEHVVKVSLEKQQLARENINLKESLALYRASEALEALEAPLELTEYLRMVLEIAIGELGGDAANLVLFEGPPDARRVETRIDQNRSGGGNGFGDEAMLQLADRLMEESGSLVIPEGEGPGPLMVLPLRSGKDLLGLLAVRRSPGSQDFTPAQAKTLSIIGSGAGVAVKNARLFNSLQEQYLGAIRSLVTAVEAKDPYTRGHSEKIAHYGRAVAERIGAEQEIVDGMRVAGLLHDSGKIGVPESILLKEGPLTSEEYTIIQEHAAMSERIVKPLALPEHVLHAIAEHHERLDGSGYPKGLGSDELTLVSRIIAVVDVYDALTSDRIYRHRLSRQEAFESIDREVRASRLDGTIVEVWRDLVEEGEVETETPE
jgi:response regulator RpfG family c-di-GMP phosphodiesterase